MRSRWLIILLLIGFVSIGVRFLIFNKMHQSALLYVLGPYLIALALTLIPRKVEITSVKQHYKRLVIDSLIVMLGSSIILFEGFLCVLMFMPLYFSVIFFRFSAAKHKESLENSKSSKLYTSIFPILVIALSLEGVTPELSFNRESEASASRVVALSVAEIKENMKKPIVLSESDYIFLNLFPMPTNVVAGTLDEGSVHEIYYDYFKWFFTNVHSGRTLLKIEEVADFHVKTKIEEDTSYISNYIKFKGTLVSFEEIDAETTKVTITVYYDRLLDPSWYFGPMQKYAISLMSDHLIKSIMERPQVSNT